MSLLRAVGERLSGAGIRFALIGGEALALRGASRATFDRDLLATDPRALSATLWQEPVMIDARHEIRLGDEDDPLAGVARFEAPDERDVDLIVGRHPWQERILERAEPVDLGDARVALPRVADLILLKLYAGGPQDLWDVEQLLAASPAEAIVSEVAGRIAELPADCAALWRRVHESRRER